MAPALSCKRKTEMNKTRHGCNVESYESTRSRVELSQPKDHEDHIASRGDKSMNHCNSVLKINPDAASNQDPGCQSSSGDRMEEARNEHSLETGGRPVAKKRLFLKYTETKKKVHFVSLMDICHLKNAELEPKTPKVSRTKRAPRGPWSRRLWSLRSFEQGSSASQMTANSWTLLQSCQKVKDKQPMRYQHTLKLKWRMLSDCSKFPKSECPDVWIRLPRQESVWKTQ